MPEQVIEGGIEQVELEAVHSKRSVYRSDGEQLLNGLVQPLLGSREVVQSNLQRLHEEASVGMLVPRSFLLRVNRRNTASNLAHLDWLEEEAIFILREVAASFERPALLFSGGKDSCVVLRLAEKAFKLKEDIRIYADEAMRQEMLLIRARAIIGAPVSFPCPACTRSSSRLSTSWSIPRFPLTLAQDV